MKICNVVIMIFILFIVNDHQVYCNKSGAKMKRSMMTYLNSLFSPVNNDKLNHMRTHSINNKPISSDYKFQSRSTGSNSEDVIQSPKEIEQPGSGDTADKSTDIIDGTKPSTQSNRFNVIEMNWLMISSPLFNDIKMFPPVRIPSGELIYIHTDSNLFRVNDAYFAKIDSRPPSSREFWFRLSGLNLYYSVSASDINILGSIAIEHIVKLDDIARSSIDNNPIFCFYVIDRMQNYWKLCGYKKEIIMKFFCLINNILEELSPDCLPPDSSTDNVVIEKEISQPIIIIPLPSQYCNDDWNYQNNGDDWQCGCSEGKQQSPIDLPDISRAIESPVTPVFMYNTLGADLIDENEISIEGTIKKDNIKFSYKDNALRIIHSKLGKIETSDGVVYNADEIVFHTPAEHTIESRKFDMEVQIIHSGIKAIGKHVSLSFLIEKTPGIINQFFEDLNYFELPNTYNKVKVLPLQIYIPKIFHHKNSETEQNSIPNMLPFSFYTYQGSITFPPCSENTIVYVASQPIKLGSSALSLFQEALRLPDRKNEIGDIIAFNWIPVSNRNTQPLNGRPVFYYNHKRYCGNNPEIPKQKEEGHYEKIQIPINRYFYVNNDKPSGLPNSFVVSKVEANGVMDDSSCL